MRSTPPTTYREDVPLLGPVFAPSAGPMGHSPGPTPTSVPGSYRRPSGTIQISSKYLSVCSTLRQLLHRSDRGYGRTSPYGLEITRSFGGRAVPYERCTPLPHANKGRKKPHR